MLVRTIAISICLLLTLQPLAVAASSVGCCRADGAQTVSDSFRTLENDAHCCSLSQAASDPANAHGGAAPSNSGDRDGDPDDRHGPADPCDCSHRCACGGAGAKPPMMPRGELVGTPRAVSSRTGTIIAQSPPSGPTLAGPERPPKA